MATIIIKRSTEYLNRERNFNIFLDEKKIGTISNGETKEFETSSGYHSIVAKIDWCSSPLLRLELSPTDKKELTIGGLKNGFRNMQIAMGIIGLHFLLKTAFKINYTEILLIPASLYLIYIFTLGRKKYLTLSEL